MDKKKLGRRVRQARRDSGMTGERLAELCNINATYLRQIESGAKSPSLPLFVELCRQMRVSPDYLLGDVLPGTVSGETDALARLWRKASPRQLKLVEAMIRGAMDALDD